LEDTVPDTCLFCAIASGRIPSSFVFESPLVVAFRDIHPQAPTHVLILPRQHVASFGDLAAESVLWPALIAATQAVITAEHLHEGYRIVVNTGDNGGQTVPHLHLHLLGHRQMQWPPG
jgi:histidine triad (HIT) family protein